jgi:hypothetical protein
MPMAKVADGPEQQPHWIFSFVVPRWYPKQHVLQEAAAEENMQHAG